MPLQTSTASAALSDEGTNWSDSYNQHTIMAWLMPLETTGGYIIFKRNSWYIQVVGTTGVDMRLRYFADYSGGGASDGEYESSDNSLAQDVPVHVAVVHDRQNAGVAVIYINGIPDTTVLNPSAGNPRTSMSYHRLFNDWVGNDSFGGQMADFRLYSRLVPEAEVETVANSRGGDYDHDNLEVRLPMDELAPGATPTTGGILDISENARNFSVENASFTYTEDEFTVSPRTSRRLVS
jgi:hypothetical protein